MKTITFKAPSGRVHIEGLKKIPIDALIKLSGVDCQDDFAEYSDLHKKLNSGYMHFEYIDGKLYTITKYSLKEELTEKEILFLKEETQGQWSDGIGEGFEQFECTYFKGMGVFISPWFYGQEIEIIIE
jgi:hypothetical protein